MPATVFGSVDRGTANKIGSALSGANTVDFFITSQDVVNAVFQAIGTLTNLASSLQFDNTGTGNNFTDLIAAGSFLASGKPLVGVSLAQNTPLVPGRYRFNMTAGTGPADIWLTISKG